MTYHRFDPRSFRLAGQSTLATVATAATEAAPSLELSQLSRLSQSYPDAIDTRQTATVATGLVDVEPTSHDWTPEDWQAYFEERAGVREHDGGMSRTEAEARAFDDAVTHWLRLHPVPGSDPRRGCVHCGASDQPDNALLPILAHGGHVWVHDRCVRAWEARRRDAAVAVLRDLDVGIRLRST